MKTLRVGDCDHEIALLNEYLAQAGYPTTGNETFTPELEKSVMKFQEEHGLNVDGIVGFFTWEALLLGEGPDGAELTDEDFRRASLLIDCEPAAIKAVQEVESGNRHGFVAPGQPTILFEGHIFWSQLKKRGIDPEKHAEGNSDILYPRWNKSHYLGGIDEYKRLEKARLIDREAADASTSWGMFQIMGFNFAVCGEDSVASFVNTMSRNARGQLKLFVHLIRRSNMHQPLRNKDWATFARRYNGPQFAENRYDSKLAAAYSKYAR